MFDIKLTATELSAVSKVLDATLECMTEYDAEYKEYQDNGGFILTLDIEELKALKRAKKKI